MRAMTSGVFFRRCSTAARAAHAVDLDIALDELPAAGGDRRRVDAEQGGDASVAAPPALERFESGEQAPLLLVEEAGEQDDGGAQLVGHQVGVGQGPAESGRGHQQSPGAQLARPVCVVGGAVEELAGELVPGQALVADELAQGVLGADTEQVVEFVDEVSGLGVVDEGLGGGDEGAGPREADAGERPQAAVVEVGEFVERGDGLLAEQGDDGVGGELDWSHCGTITDSRFRNDATILGRIAPANRAGRRVLGRIMDTCMHGTAVPYCDTTAISRKLFLSGPFRVVGAEQVTYQWRVFLAFLNPVRGSEQSGRRPVLVVSREEINQLLPVVNTVPLTSRKPGRRIYPNEALVPSGTACLRVDSIALCYQVRTVDKGRLERQLGEVADMRIRRAITEALRFQLEI